MDRHVSSQPDHLQLHYTVVPLTPALKNKNITNDTALRHKKKRRASEPSMINCILDKALAPAACRGNF
jgi:hypothetical protein